LRNRLCNELPDRVRRAKMARRHVSHLMGASVNNDPKEPGVGLAVADRWFDLRRVAADITLIWEPHVIRLMQCNIWHVRGRDRDLLIDTGFGVASLYQAAQHLFDKPLSALATHTHIDHVGSLHEFAERLMHPAEAYEMENAAEGFSLLRDDHPVEFIDSVRRAGYEVDETFVTALPCPDLDMRHLVRPAAPATRLIDEGDVIDLGDRAFEVLHLPGHSPGSIGLWEAATGTLFSGDAIYDGPLLDELPGSDVDIYMKTMRRLLELPVSVVHAGHDPSFDGRRLRVLARQYLDRRGG
jgi:glyoxylase-like metal-dependent hydrolase (beta-lactamase superfamily II)